MNLGELPILAKVIKENETVKYLDLSTHQYVEKNDVKVLKDSMQIILEKNKTKMLVNATNGANAFVLDRQITYGDHPIYKAYFCKVL